MADKEVVLEFINNFVNYDDATMIDNFTQKFSNGYCWHFAHLLKQTFQQGYVCIDAPYGHFVWIDKDNNIYDINGITTPNGTLIPEEFLNDALLDFKHIPNLTNNTTEEEIQKIIDTFNYYNEPFKDNDSLTDNLRCALVRYAIDENFNNE